MHDPLEEAARRVEKARENYESFRRDLEEEIIAASATGRKQVDIVRITGYTRERIRRIVRGLPAGGRRAA